MMARGNARQRIVRDDHDRERLLDDLRRTVLRCGWELLAFVFMENHLHLLLKTPRPNLARACSIPLSYAIWHGRRHRRVGHLFQGRYRAELIEDESYYWTVSQYIHLNPVRAGLVDGPDAWRWSSYPGYAEPSHRLPWVAHEALLSAWRGEHGGTVSARAYRRFVEAGLRSPLPRRSARPSVAGCWARSGSSLGCGSWPGLSCLIHRFRVLVNWPQEIRRPSLRRFLITSAWSVRLWRVAAIRTSLERPPPGSAASVRLCFWFFVPASVIPASVRLCFWFFVEFEGRSCSTHRMPRRPRNQLRVLSIT